MSVLLALASARVARFPFRLRCSIILAAAACICSIRFVIIVRGRLGVRVGMDVLLRRWALVAMTAMSRHSEPASR